LTRRAEAVVGSRIAAPVIIRAAPRRLREVVEQIRPFTGEFMEEVLPRIVAPAITPFTAYPLRAIPRFNLVAAYLPREVVFALADGPYVERIYHDQVMYAFQYPTVPPEGVYKAPHRLTKEIAFTSTDWTRRLMGADRANAKGFLGRGVLAAITDTGASRVHEQIRRVRFETTMAQHRDENGHGTHVTSTVGGVRARDDYLSQRAGAPVYCEGMAPECDLMAIKCLGYFVGMGSTSNIIEALDMAAEHGAEVINLSLGGDSETKAAEEDPYFDVFDQLVGGGAIPVVAAGNSGPDEGTVGSPGCLPNVLTVGSYDPIKGEVAEYSSRGPTNWGDVKPDCMAPGSNVDSGIVGVLDVSGDGFPSRYSPISGTSMATPHVTGLVVLMRESMRKHLGRMLTLGEVKEMLQELGGAKNNTDGWGTITWRMWEEWMDTRYGVKL
jgi:subtilisin family serine protease